MYIEHINLKKRFSFGFLATLTLLQKAVFLCTCNSFEWQSIKLSYKIVTV